MASSSMRKKMRSLAPRATLAEKIFCEDWDESRRTILHQLNGSIQLKISSEKEITGDRKPERSVWYGRESVYRGCSALT
ncbi:hypothetical protein EVAR_93849_1 [Eumeta japonica]|uniref:Uncharacterized protein n=1 Tax=Eumeta variegata TaxID=151549 RepID=A0A4C1TXV8_EUMVA|nr:hypothetical protein EVAR_93849_1 [Eumeta japonica]